MQWVAWWRKLPFWGKQQVGLWCPMMSFPRRGQARDCLEQFIALQSWSPSEFSAVILPRGVHPEKKTTIKPGELPPGDYPSTW